MTTMISATVTVDDTRYRITRMTDGDTISIDKLEPGDGWIWVGNGRRNDQGQIYDCAATIPEAAYEALEEALSEAIDASLDVGN